MAEGQLTSRQKILKAATELSLETGPGNLSLDAVAARAGLSKGGLLYNFPTKARLLEALVEDHLAKFDADIESENTRRAAERNALALAFLSVVRADEKFKKAPPTGILAALAENPEFLDPVRRYNRILIDRMKAGCADASAALVAFLAIEGMRTTQLLGVDVLTDEERDLAMSRLEAVLAGEAA